MSTGERIRARRESLGMSQSELAEKAGYTDRSSIAKIERGKVDLTQSKLEAIAAALRTTPQYLSGWDETESIVSKQGTEYRVSSFLDFLSSANIHCKSIDDEIAGYETGDPTKPVYRLYDSEKRQRISMEYDEFIRRAELAYSVIADIVETTDEDVLFLYEYVGSLDPSKHEVELTRRLFEGILAERRIKDPIRPPTKLTERAVPVVSLPGCGEDG